MKVALYLRIAHHNDDSADLMSVHERYLRAWAEEHGHEVVDVFRDFGTGTTLQRPGLQALFNKADKKCFEGVLTKDFGRLVCGLELVLPLAEIFHKAGIKVIAPFEAENGFEFCAQMISTLKECYE